MDISTLVEFVLRWHQNSPRIKPQIVAKVNSVSTINFLEILSLFVVPQIID
jgi:hypothetical protein